MVEANARVHQMLRRSVESRPDAARFHLSDAFVGMDDEPVAFRIDEKWSGTSSSYIYPEDAHYKGKGEQRVAVEHTRSRLLGDVVRELGITDGELVLAKMDIEGGELAALRGAAEWLRSLRGWAIVCEVNEEFWGVEASASEIAEALSDFGEVFYVSRGDRARAFAGEGPPPERDVVIASPGPVADAVRALRRPPWV
jgi:FkbM family methyltransferase